MTASRQGRCVTALIALLLVLSASPAIAGEDESASDAPTDQSTGIDDEATTQDTQDTEPDFDPTDPEQVFREIVFPVVGPTTFTKGFGACRDGCTREHKGIDILSRGWKGVPVVAAHDGVVTSARTGGELSGCSVEITARDGWSSIYVHLNTDIPGTDVEGAVCFAPGIEVGARVDAGTLIGWVGDSGNAEDTVPNLHFEIRNPDDISVDPWVSLIGAERIDYGWLGTEGLIDLSTSIDAAKADIVYVVEASNLAELALPDTGTASFDVPIIPYDAIDPSPALAALRDLSPDRTVVLIDGEPPSFVDDLYRIAPLVAVALLPQPVPIVDLEGESRNPTDTGMRDGEIDPSRYPEQQTDWFTILIAGKVDTLSRRLRTTIESLGSEHRVIVLNTWRRFPSDVGSSAIARPQVDASRNYLWWNTAQGWQLSESLEDVPEPGLAYLREVDVKPWTLAFLSSLASSPPMPVWHYQSTSRATRSL